jgi:hypothetical protein
MIRKVHNDTAADASTEPRKRSEKLQIILFYQPLTAVAQNVDSGNPSQYGPRGLVGRFPDRASGMA